MKPAACPFALLLVLFATATSAQTIYRHVDAEGRVTLSDQPVATVPAVDRSPEQEVERALAGRTRISSARNSQINANEAARRARQEARNRALESRAAR